jgi:hypothetical protein
MKKIFLDVIDSIKDDWVLFIKIFLFFARWVSKSSSEKMMFKNDETFIILCEIVNDDDIIVSL